MSDVKSASTSIQVLSRMFSLLDTLARDGDAVSLKLISEQTGLHPSTAHRILNDLAVGGMVERSGPGSYRLGLRLQELAQAGQAAPGCLRYELRQADGDSDLWLLHSEWSDDAAMQAYLAGDAQRVFAEVLWQALAATLDVQERPF